MSRTKAVLDEYLRHKNYPTHSQHVKYVPVDYQSRNIYPYDLLSSGPSKRISHRQHINRPEHKPNVRTYYIPVPAKHELSSDETFYKHGGVSDHYIHPKAYSNYYLPEPTQKTISGDHHQHHSSVVYLKYPKPIHEEKLSKYYAAHIDGESGDYIREEDLYEYDDNQNVSYFEPGRKANYENIFVRNEELYYSDYVPEISGKNRSTRIDKNSDYYSQYTPTVISQQEKRHKYYYKDNKVNNNNIEFQETPQKIKTAPEYSETFVEPVKQDYSVCDKTDSKKISDNESEVSTIYDLQSNNIPIYNNTFTVSSQTSNTDKIDDNSLKLHLKESYSKSTQTLELDFTEKKINSSNKETQTVGENMDKTHVSSKDKIGNERASTAGEDSNLTESVIRWMRRILLYFLWNMYNCPNLEQIVFCAPNPAYNKNTKNEVNHSSSLPQQDHKRVRSFRPRKIIKSKRNAV